KAKPPKTYRIVLLGSSHEFGIGVADTEVFDNLVEDKLTMNDARGTRYEILNFSQPADSTFEYLWRLEHKATGFSPDIVVLFVNMNETKRTLSHLASVFKNGTEIPYRFVSDLYAEANLSADMPTELLVAKLKPFTDRIMRYGYQQFADFSRRTGIPIYVVYRPPVVLWSKKLGDKESRERKEILDLAKEASLPVIDLSNAFAGVRNRRSLMVTAFDDHMNAEAHRLLA